jgi:hypothetical protein
MKLNCVVSATNEEYSHCAEYFVKFWLKLFPEIDVKIFYVGPIYPHHLSSISNHIIFVDSNHDAIKHIKTPFLAQNIRLYGPAIMPHKEGVLISDIDMYPMNRSYYIDPITEIPNDHFITYRGGYYMCYNIASPSTWSEIFKVKTFNDCLEKLKASYPEGYGGNRGGKGWHHDQYLLNSMVKSWDKFSTHHDFNIESGFSRLDRAHGTPQHQSVADKIVDLQYSDFHLNCDKSEHLKWVYDKLPQTIL